MSQLPLSKNLVCVLAENHEHSLEQIIDRIPVSFLSRTENELLVIDDGSRDGTFFAGDRIRERLRGQVRVTVLKNPVNQGYGGNQKLGLRYAIDQGFDRVFIVHGDGRHSPERLTELFDGYRAEPEPEAVFGVGQVSFGARRLSVISLLNAIGGHFLLAFQRLVLRSRLSIFPVSYPSFTTRLLRRIPFERNSNDARFDSEIILQCLTAGAKIAEVVVEGTELAPFSGIRHMGRVMAATLRYRLQQMGFLYDRKFDLGIHEYPFKSSRYSSHSRLIEGVSPGSRVLDLGCGQGWLAKALLAKGCVIDGVDLLPLEALKAPLRQYFRIDFNRESDALIPVLKENSYDYIILADVIEHLVEPEAFLDLIRASRALHSRPRLLVSTGNVGFLVVRAMLALGQFNYAPRGILDRTHTRLFTLKSFRRVFEQSGFRVRRMATIPMPFTSIFRSEKGWPLWLESVNHQLANYFPGLLSYQFLLEAEPLPTAEQLLQVCEEYSEKLRKEKVQPIGRDRSHTEPTLPEWRG